MNNRDLNRFIKYLDSFDKREILQSTNDEGLKCGRMYVIAQTIGADKIIAKLPLNKFNKKEVLAHMTKKGFIQERKGEYILSKKNYVLYVGWYSHTDHIEQWGLFAIDDDPDNFEYINFEKKQEKIKVNDKFENKAIKDFFDWFDTYDFNNAMTDFVSDELKQYCEVCVDIVTDDGQIDVIRLPFNKEIDHRPIKKSLQSMSILNRAGNFIGEISFINFIIKVDCTDERFDKQFILELGKYYVFQDGWEEELYVDEL